MNRKTTIALAAVAALVALAVQFGIVDAAAGALVVGVGMTVLTESSHAGEFLLSEANGNRSRENVTVVSGQVLDAGTVVGKVTATGKYAIYSNGASDGTEVAAGVLLNAVDASGGDTDGVIIARDAEVIADSLIFESGGTATTAGIADLAAIGIIAR
jgi:hypothetical protein